MNEHNQPAGFYFWNPATVFWWRCPTRAVRNCQTSVLVAGACRSLELLTMLPLPHFYTAPKWAQANLMELLSACPSRLLLLSPDHCYLRKKHCSASHLPVVLFNMTIVLARRLFATSAFAGFGFTFEGKRHVWREKTEARQSQREVGSTCSHQTAWRDNLSFNCSGETCLFHILQLLH